MARGALIESKTVGEAQPLAELDDILGFHIRLAHGAVLRHFTVAFSELGLTQKQVSVLWLVADEPGISQIAVGGRLRMDRTTTMTLVKRLQASKLIARERSGTDGRKQLLHITDDGRAALVKAKKCVAQHEAWLKSRFDADEIKNLVEMLKRIHE